MNSAMVKIVECPRDAMQGLPEFIETKVKAAYINSLLKVGFDTIDFGSFVSPAAIPQLRDTEQVLGMIDKGESATRLLSIIANIRGAEKAASFDLVDCLGYPHSVSPSFLKKNINSNTEKSLDTISEMLEICDKQNKELVVYLSMGFGNPYNDEWSVDIVEDSVGQLSELGVTSIPLSDTIGVSKPEHIANTFARVIGAYPDIEFGFHLHTNLTDWYDQIDAAYKNGCRRFDTVILGLGGCPMAEQHDLAGNMKTVNLIEYLEEQGETADINKNAFEDAYIKSLVTFHNFLS